MTLRRLAPVALVVLAATLAGCSRDDTPADPGPAADDVVVQALLLPTGKDPQAVADYTLYGDGRLYSVAPGGAAFPTLRLHQVNPATAQALRRSALNVVAGGSMADSGPQLNSSPQATTTVRVRFGNTEEAMPRSAADALLVDLAKASGGPRFRTFTPARVAIIATQTQATGATRPWTVNALTNGKPFRRAGTICTVLAAAQVPLAQQSAAGTTAATVWTSAGRAYHLTFRPLLPTESDCTSL
jgi:hypothetical protein